MRDVTWEDTVRATWERSMPSCKSKIISELKKNGETREREREGSRDWWIEGLGEGGGSTQAQTLYPYLSLCSQLALEHVGKPQVVFKMSELSSD